jgi:hypothetical protein
MGTNKAPKRAIAALDRALRATKALVDLTEESRCSVADEHKEAVRLYVETWVIPYMEDAITDLKGGEPTPEWMGGYVS